MARKKKIPTVKITVRLTLPDQQALASAAATLERDPNWVLGKLAHLAAGTVDLSVEVRRWLRGDTAFDAGLAGDQKALLVIGNDDPPVIRVERRKTVAQNPPSLEEIQEYLRQKAYGFSAAEFHAFYSANGWVQGSTSKPLLDWKAACVTWQARWMREHGVSEHVSAADWGANRPPELDAPAEPADDQTESLDFGDDGEEAGA